MRKISFLLLLLLVLSLAACGGESAPGEGAGPGGDAAAGEKLFAGGAQPACNTCHSLEAGVKLVGPSLAKMGAQADSRVSGQPAQEYLRKSIVEPNDYVPDGFAANIMPATYGSSLSDKQVDDLVAFMLTLE
jgi:cytochrome c551/c552